MLVKFIPTRVERTSINAVLSYLFQKKDVKGKPREIVQQVSGTMPEMLSFLSELVPSRNPFSHSVLTFSDGDMARTTEPQRIEILTSYINELAIGLGDKNRMPFIAVDHGDHFHVVVLRYDLKSGKVYQPFVKFRGDTQRFNCWKSLMCLKYGLVEPRESGSWFRLSDKHAGGAVKRLLDVLNKVGGDVVAGRAEIDTAAVVQGLIPVIEGEGFEVVRMTRSGFSVRGADMKRNVRFRYTRKMMGYVDEENIEDVGVLKERLACRREKLMIDMDRYHELGVPDVRSELDINKGSSSPLYGCHCISRKSGNGISSFS